MRNIFILLSTGVLAFCITTVHAELYKPKTVNFTNSIPAGKLIHLRLMQLPKHSNIHIDATSDGAIAIALIRAGDNNRSTVKKPVFNSIFKGHSLFDITNDLFGDYFITLDNRNGDKKRQVKLSVTVSKSDGITSANKTLIEFEKKLHQLYKFSPVNINADSCKTPNAYSTPVGIILCERYIEKIYQELDNAQKTKDVILFTIFHEFGHTLLQQWDYPFYDSEKYADQFATASLIMLQQKSKLQATIDLFNSRSTEKKALFQPLKNSSHASPKDRAKMISQWREDSDFIVKWQRMLFPHMQTTFLKNIYSHKPEWLDEQIAKQELAQRL